MKSPGERDKLLNPIGKRSRERGPKRSNSVRSAEFPSHRKLPEQKNELEAVFGREAAVSAQDSSIRRDAVRGAQ